MLSNLLYFQFDTRIRTAFPLVLSLCSCALVCRFYDSYYDIPHKQYAKKNLSSIKVSKLSR